MRYSSSINDFVQCWECHQHYRCRCCQAALYSGLVLLLLGCCCGSATLLSNDVLHVLKLFCQVLSDRHTLKVHPLARHLITGRHVQPSGACTTNISKTYTTSFRGHAKTDKYSRKAICGRHQHSVNTTTACSTWSSAASLTWQGSHCVFLCS